MFCVVDGTPTIIRRPDVEQEVDGNRVTAQIGNPDVIGGEGQTVRVVCDAAGSGVNIAWYGPDGMSAGSGSPLVIREFDGDKAGMYTCEATNRGGKDTEAITAVLGGRIVLIIEFFILTFYHLFIESPKISSPDPVVPERPLPDEDREYPVGQISDVRRGRTLTLTCSSVGIPPGDISWTLPSGTSLRIGESEGQVSVNDNGDLTIRDSRDEDVGQYTCTAINSLGAVGRSSKVNVYGI